MNLIAHYRKTNRMTQERLAEKVHMLKNYLGDIERGYQLPWASEAHTIANYFGVRVEVMFPDGFRLKKSTGRKREDMNYVPPEPYMPPEPEIPVRQYPREFKAECYHCRRRLAMRADDNHYAAGNEPHEPSCLCGAVLYDIVPIEEAMHV
jgi:transcriptional regulator with XRE-family HTH domain